MEPIPQVFSKFEIFNNYVTETEPRSFGIRGGFPVRPWSTQKTMNRPGRDLLGVLAILSCRFVVASAFFERGEEIRADPSKPLQSGS
jgi:hypothetical protein